MITEYTLETFAGDEVRIAIDSDIMTEETLTLLSEFWSGHHSRLDEARGDITASYVKFLAEQALSVQAQGDLNSYGVMKWFDDAEGFCKMDGTAGILIHYCTVLEYDVHTTTTRMHHDKMPELPRGNL